jgi:hypothetical protein
VLIIRAAFAALMTDLMLCFPFAGRGSTKRPKAVKREHRDGSDSDDDSFDPAMPLQWLLGNGAAEVIRDQ